MTRNGHKMTIYDIYDHFWVKKFEFYSNFFPFNFQVWLEFLYNYTKLYVDVPFHVRFEIPHLD